MHPPKNKLIQIGFWFVFFGIVVTACFLRFQNIDQRPFHTDEAENAYMLAKDLEGESYTFNPEHNHGPTLHYLLKTVCVTTGTKSFEQMNERLLRSVIVSVSLLTLLLIPFLKNAISNTGLLTTTALVATSPLLIYYSNYVIHEVLLGFLTLLIIVFGVSYSQSSNKWKALVIGLCAGTLFATKITSSIIIFSWAIPILVSWSKEPGVSKTLSNGAIWFLAGAITTTVLFYSSFLRNIHGVWDAFASFFVYQTEVGHEKPWNYYLAKFIVPNWKNPFFTHESIVVVCALVGAFAAIVNRKNKLGIILLSSTLIQILIYSLIPYKTPWLMLIPWLQLTILGGMGFSFIWGHSNTLLRVVCLLMLTAGLSLQFRTNSLLNQRFHSDVRNPLVYAPTSTSIRKLPSFLTKYPSERIDVFGSFIWPTPWYLRQRDEVYYHVSTDNNTFSNIVIVTDETYPLLKDILSNEFNLYPYTLRPNFPIYVCIHKKLTGFYEQ